MKGVIAMLNLQEELVILDREVASVNLLLEKYNYNTRFKIVNKLDGTQCLVMGCVEQLAYGTHQRVLINDITVESVELVLAVVSSILEFEGVQLHV